MLSSELFSLEVELSELESGVLELLSGVLEPLSGTLGDGVLLSGTLGAGVLLDAGGVCGQAVFLSEWLSPAGQVQFGARSALFTMMVSSAGPEMV